MLSKRYLSPLLPFTFLLTLPPLRKAQTWLSLGWGSLQSLVAVWNSMSRTGIWGPLLATGAVMAPTTPSSQRVLLTGPTRGQVPQGRQWMEAPAVC